MSWTLFTVRHLLLAGYYLGHNQKYCTIEITDDMCDWSLFVSELIRFPSLVCNSMTVSIWWIILFPILYYFLKTKSSQSALKAFVDFNKSFMLINVHLLNLPFAALDHILEPRMLVFGDLYVGLVVAIIYMLIYLFIMDPMGMHFYHVILSPRPHWCVISYSGIMALFPAFLYLFNYISFGEAG